MNALLHGTHAWLAARYADAAGSERFPSVEAGLRAQLEGESLAPDELARLVAVFAEHECGEIPLGHAAFLRECARLRRAGLVSNIWAPPERFEARHGKMGLEGVFEHRVWSAEAGAIKPSPRIFGEALRRFGVEAGEVVYVGDHYPRDVAPAKALGLAAVWVNPEGRPVPEGGAEPDDTVRDLPELAPLLFH